MGQVDYPRDLSVSVNETVTYNAAVDIRDDPLPPDQVIDSRSGEPVGEPISVKCRLAAKLIPVGDHIKVNGASEGDWVRRQFTPSGVVEWSWSVKSVKPVNQQLRLLLVPAILIEGGEYVYGAENEASLTTNVAVKATLIERVSYWFETQWPLLAAIATALAVAIAASRRWVQEQIKALKRRKARRRGVPGGKVAGK